MSKIPEAIQKLKGRDHNKHEELIKLKIDTDTVCRDGSLNIDDIISSLIQGNVVKNSDIALVNRYKELYQLYEVCKQQLSANQLTVGEGSRVKINPVISLMLKTSDAILQIEKELGLSPASKRKITKLQVLENNTVIDEYTASRKEAFNDRRAIREGDTKND